MTRSLCLLCLLACLCLVAAVEARPNVLLIVADDLGYADVGFNGCQDIPTPAIDRLAAEGVRLTDGYVTFPVCSPSRAGLITGRHQQRFGYERNPIYNPRDPLPGLPLEERTLADVLRAAGYATGVLGKWHLGAHERFHPFNRGFDEFYGFLTGGHDYFPENLTLTEAYHYDAYRLKMMRGRQYVEESEYVTDALSREACDFVRRHAEEPWLLYLAYNAPHTPMQAPREVIERFGAIPDKRRRTYAAMVHVMDAGIGRVLETLDAEGVADDTVVFFLSDNGGPTTNASSNKPLRGHKGSVYEGGLRVPFVVRWPAALPAGEDYPHPISSLDIFATAATAAGALDHVDAERPLDGVDLTPYLTGAKGEPPHDLLFWRNSRHGGYAARSGGLKLTHAGSEPSDALYDLEADLGERNDLAAERVAEREHLKAEWDRWNAEMIDPIFVGLESIETYRKEWGF